MSHARLGPSNHRWPHCPGSVREEANYPDIPGEAAIDGTGSHLLLEMCLENNVPAIQYDQQIIGANHPDHSSGWLVGPERIERVQMCLDYIIRRVNELKVQYPGCTVTVEAESTSNPGAMFGRDDWWGTCDITIICRHDHTGEVMFIEVVDYKDGRGWVHAKNNTQLVSYLSGKMHPFIGRVKHCRMTIVQPKTNPVIRYQCSTRAEDEMTPGSVIEHATALNQAAIATDAEDAPVVPGKHCQWCKANPKRGGHCMAATDKSLQVVKTMSNTEVVSVDNLPAFEYIGKVVADPKSLTSEQLSELISAKEALMTVFDRAEAEAQERIESGQSVPGYAMRPGRGSNVWNEDEETIVKKLKAKRLKLDQIYPKKLASPAQILKAEGLSDVQKKKIESELVTHKAGKDKLTKVAHDSVAQSSTNVLQSAEQMFGDVPPATEPAPSLFAESDKQFETPSFF